MPRVLVVYGPNLNLLGEREPDVYGRETMEGISARLREEAAREGVSLDVTATPSTKPSPASASPRWPCT